jgi:outer membrane protein OmpA-like peptidoglycan-associated protein
MKYILFLLSIFAMPFLLSAQQQSSKSKSSDKLYEKGGIKHEVTMAKALGVNTSKDEFSPAFYQNGIVYVSYHKSGPIDPKTGKPYFELFFAETDAMGLPQKPREFSLQVNSQVHEGSVSFSRDGNFLYFTRNNLEGGIPKTNSKDKVTLKIYEASRGKYDWQGIRSLPFNSDEYSCVHPSLSADGSRLFFASNMPGGYGGYDLYYTEKNTENWSQPINLGAAINTEGNELFPFIHKSDLLFFSSNGHKGKGGLDLFMVSTANDAFGVPENLEAPYNSPEDDLGFILNEDATRGYLSSSRKNGSGGDDIYMFEADGEPIIEMEEVILNTMVVAYDEQTGERLSNAGVRILERTEDGFVDGDEVYDVEMTPSPSGELMMKLVRKNADSLKEPAYYTNLNGEAVFNMIQDRSYVVLVTKDGFQSGEVMHSTDGQFGPQTIRVPLRSKNCTTLNGLVSVNGYRNGVPNALVRILNKSTGAQEELRSNSNGEFDYCLPVGYEYTITALKDGYTEGSTTLSTATGNPRSLDVTVRLNADKEEVVKEPIREGSVIVLENIYYDFDKYFIRRGAAQELDALAQLMKSYPSMEVQLIAHTDSRGDDEYNLDLSVKRADSARRYLIQKGIEGHRVEAFGYGEKNIRNHCKNGVECSDEEHQYNRRTEVKIIRIDEPVQVEYDDGQPLEKGNK